MLLAEVWSRGDLSLNESLGFEHTPPYPETGLPEDYHDDATSCNSI